MTILKKSLEWSIPWMLILGVVQYFMAESFGWENVIAVIIVGFIMGYLYVLGLNYTEKKTLSRIRIDLPESAQTIKQGIVTLMTGKKKYMGKMVLTNEQLFFKSDKYKGQYHVANFDLTDISDISRQKVLKNHTSGMIIHYGNGEKIQFSMLNAGSWIQQINDAILQKRSK